MIITLKSIVHVGYEITKGHTFISWQTWDLLRLMCYGFLEFTEDFLLRHPGYTIYPIRLNGSAIESYFSELRAISGGNLSGANYRAVSGTAKIRLKTKAKHHKDDYRKSLLSFRQHQLAKRHRRSRRKL